LRWPKAAAAWRINTPLLVGGIMLVFCELNRSLRDDPISKAKAALEKELGDKPQPLHNCRVSKRSRTFFEWLNSTQVRQTLVLCGHGTADTKTLGGYSALQVANELNRQAVSSDDISVIRLYSCSVGDTPASDQHNFAQQLVIELNKEDSALKGVEVYAPMGLLVLYAVKSKDGLLLSWTWKVRRSNGVEISLEEGMVPYAFNPSNPERPRGYIPPTL
jgi:hypothetical protein